MVLKLVIGPSIVFSVVASCFRVFTPSESNVYLRSVFNYSLRYGQHSAQLLSCNDTIFTIFLVCVDGVISTCIFLPSVLVVLLFKVNQAAYFLIASQSMLND